MAKLKVILGTRDTSRWPEFAGSTWVRLQYMLGFQEMGVEIFWVDRLSAVDVFGEDHTPHPTGKPRLAHPHSVDYLARRFHRTAREFGFEDHYCIVYNKGERHFGLSQESLQKVIDSADLLVNISGHLPADSPLMAVPKRAYVDVDPGFTQIWALDQDMSLGRHNFFFTVGQNVGTPQFTIPLRGVDWQVILPPVALDHWPARIDPRCTRFGTVGDWRGSQHAMYEQEYYGGKRREYISLMHVPQASRQTLELALCIGPEDWEDLGLLQYGGWRVLDPYLYAGDPESYREFIQLSRAEFSVAKSGYVKSNSGWISDRTACYLASGKPALVQSTGAEWRFPAGGKGLVTFRSMQEAVAGIEAINGDYVAHCDAARRLAEDLFDSQKVLRRMLERVQLI